MPPISRLGGACRGGARDADWGPAGACCYACCARAAAAASASAAASISLADRLLAALPPDKMAPTHNLIRAAAIQSPPSLRSVNSGAFASADTAFANIDLSLRCTYSDQ